MVLHVCNMCLHGLKLSLQIVGFPMLSFMLLSDRFGGLDLGLEHKFVWTFVMTRPILLQDVIFLINYFDIPYMFLLNGLYCPCKRRVEWAFGGDNWVSQRRVWSKLGGNRFRKPPGASYTAPGSQKQSEFIENIYLELFDEQLMF